MRMRSIQRQLIGTVLLLELLSALAVTSIVFLHERHTVFHSFDVMLRGRADSLLGAVQDAEDTDDNVMLDLADVHSPGRDEYIVRDEKGRLLGATPLAPLLHVPANMPSGSIFPITLHHRRYRVLVLDGSRWIDAEEPGGGVIRHVKIFYASPVHRAWSVILRTVFFYAFTSLVVMAATALWLLWSLRRTLAPLDDLARSAARVTAGSWKFDAPEQARRTTELSPLVTAIEDSLAGIESAFHKQQRFVGDAAHELKTAVAVVKSSLQLLTLRPRTLQGYKAGIERCQHDLMRLESLVQQMLTLARAETKTPLAIPEFCTDLYGIAQSAAHQLAPIANLHRIHIAVTGQSAPARIDTAEAMTILENLLNNAIQFSPDNASVCVHVQQVGEDVQVAVQDQGPGISPGDREHIFERFWRGDPSRSRLTGGSGLGLSIVKAIVDRCNGDIRIENPWMESPPNENSTREQLAMESAAASGTTVLIRIPSATSSTAQLAEPLRFPSTRAVED